MSYLDSALKLGANEALQKPYSADELLRAIEKLLAATSGSAPDK